MTSWVGINFLLAFKGISVDSLCVAVHYEYYVQVEALCLFYGLSRRVSTWEISIIIVTCVLDYFYVLICLFRVKKGVLFIFIFIYRYFISVFICVP